MSWEGVSLSVHLNLTISRRHFVGSSHSGNSRRPSTALVLVPPTKIRKKPNP